MMPSSFCNLDRVYSDTLIRGLQANAYSPGSINITPPQLEQGADLFVIAEPSPQTYSHDPAQINLIDIRALNRIVAVDHF